MTLSAGMQLHKLCHIAIADVPDFLVFCVSVWVVTGIRSTSSANDLFSSFSESFVQVCIARACMRRRCRIFIIRSRNVVFGCRINEKRL